MISSKESARELLGLDKVNAPADFIASLPQKLIAHPRGPIIYIGHVDVALLHGFDDPAIAGLEGGSDFPHITAGLVARGYDEEAVRKWRNLPQHRAAQAKGRGGIFAGYRLRVASVLRVLVRWRTAGHEIELQTERGTFPGVSMDDGTAVFSAASYPSAAIILKTVSRSLSMKFAVNMPSIMTRTSRYRCHLV